MKLESTNPSTGEVIGSVPITTPDEVKHAVARAREAQQAWQARPVGDRAKVLRVVQQRMWARSEALVNLVVEECGRPRTETHALEVGNISGLLDYFSKKGPKVLSPHRISIGGFVNRSSYLHYRPLGVVGIISPWNYPFALTQGPVSMALLAGNAVVVKPSEYTPLTCKLAHEIWLEAGVPEDLYQMVYGHGDVGAALIDSGVDAVVFTGSTSTGRKVAAACGERLIPCVAELGGKAPALVLPDAPLERTSEALVWGAFVNAGQTCACIERVLLEPTRHDEFVTDVVRRTKALKVGNPAKDPHTEVGPMNNQRQLDIVEALVADALDQGAELACGGHRLDGPGLFYAPTVLVGVTPHMRIAQEEVFGPVMPIIKVSDVDEMVSVANDHPLGLLGYVFGGDLQQCRRLAEELEVGTAMINDVVVTHGFPETPWGGIKESGLMHTHSDEGLRSLCQQRHVHYQWWQVFDRELWWYPYGPKREEVLVRLQKLLFGRGKDRRDGLWG